MSRMSTKEERAELQREGTMFKLMQFHEGRSEKFEAEIVKLKYMLSKCSPFTGGDYECRFCHEYLYGPHADNCEYIKMTEGSE